MSSELTRRQSAVLQFIETQIAERGFGPTVREIGAEFGIGLPNGVMCHLKALKKKGFISWDYNSNRTLQVLRPSVPRGIPVVELTEIDR